jgi:hypothetical protein
MNNQRELAQIAGDESIEVFKLSEDMANEEFRVFIKRSNNREQEQQQADSILFILLERQLIDDKFLADHLGRSTVEQIRIDLRKLVNKRILERKKAEEEQAAAAEIAAAEEQSQIAQATEDAKIEQLEQNSLAAADDQSNKQHELNKMALQGQIDQVLQTDQGGIPAQ